MNTYDPTAKASGFVPQTCELCPPSYDWCQKHNRCKRHCACNDSDVSAAATAVTE